MEGRVQQLEDKVTQLTERVDQLEQRLSGMPLPSLPQSWPLPGADVGPTAARAEMNRSVTFLGRSCLVLGGAFLIRALTDGGVLPARPGAAMGIAFAAIWLFMAHRATTRGAKVSAGFHAVIAAVIAYPLVLEATTRLGAMSVSAAALTLVGFTGLLFVIAWRDRLGWLVWVGVAGCGLASVVLLRTTEARPQLTGVLLALAVATSFWLGDRWPAVRWGPAALVDLVLLRGIFSAAPPSAALYLALAVLSVAIVLVRTATARPLGAFEISQAVAGLIIAVEGGLRLARDAGAGAAAVAGGMILASVVAIAFSGWVVPRRGNRSLDFLFYAALSIGLVASAVGLLTAGMVRGLFWSGLAIVAVLVGRLSHPLTLWSLAALLALGAEVSAGSLVGRMNAGGAITLGLIFGAYVATLPRLKPGVPSAVDGPILRLPPAVLLLLASLGGAALFVHGFRALEVDRARLGVAWTIAAVAVALGLALIRRRLQRPELSWVATLALVLGGIELALVEIPNGRPSTLLVCFALYGAALIVVPRLAPVGRDLLITRPSETKMVTRS